MSKSVFGSARARLFAVAVCMASCLAGTAPAAAAEGPWHVEVLAGGVGLEKPLPGDSPLVAAQGDWTAHGWVRPARLPGGRMLLVGVGDPQAAARYFSSDEGRLGFWWGEGRMLSSAVRLQAGRWQFVAAVARGGRLALFLEGRRVAEGALPARAVAPRLVFGPHAQPWPEAPHFAGHIAGFTVEPRALDSQALARLAHARPDDALTRFEQASPAWPMQSRQQVGQETPQPPSTLPRSRAPLSTPRAAAPARQQGLRADGERSWVLDAWQLASAEEIADADGAALSRSSAVTGRGWHVATVPGTVLGTLVDRGVYPDPAHGLDNMAIPESLNRHDWWYRSEFDLPATLAGQRLRLEFKGINYAGEAWLNGRRVGQTRGAFERGEFDVTDLLQPGRRNVLAVRVSPPPHPGLPHEQSIAGGVGENGGMQVIDGPTFVASEGWDWIPAVRDRNTGLWQDVRLHASGAVSIGDAWVASALQDDHASADLSIEVPLRNGGAATVRGELAITFEGVSVRKRVDVAPGGTSVKLDADEFPQLRVRDPRLWWPNGYGEPVLYTMEVVFAEEGAVSDRRRVRFGIREVSYELSLLNEAGQLRRVEFNPARAPGQRVVDVRRQAIRKVPGGWAQSFLPGAEDSPAVRELEDTRLSPHLAIRVNGVRIAVKGGNWGMDDWRKRSSRERLEPYFRLQRDAHMNVIRNWVGQSTQDSLYELADEYGMLLFNDFWASTQNYNQQIEDEALFLKNAADVIRRYRGHPSVVLWFGRNEGVPHPLLNEGLDALIAELDGTRLYMGSSNEVNLQGSGPYNYREPEEYFTRLAKGFSVEVGTPSFATLEAVQAMMPKADLWPISDAWAYHDWHQSGNGDTRTFMESLARKFGAATSLEDFERKAQLMNYETHRAIFEGFNAGLWSQNSGRLLWMSHPAWPSLMWQIYSHDYDTHGAYYGARKAAEPLHVQMNLPAREVVLVNNTAVARDSLRVRVVALALDGRVLGREELDVAAAPVAVTPVPVTLGLDGIVARERVAIVALELRDAEGGLLGDNVYWSAAAPEDLRRLDGLPEVALDARTERDAAQPSRLQVQVRNPAPVAVLGAKLTLVDARGERILPAYYSDNYLNLLPGQSRTVRIEVPAGTSLAGAQVKLRGWNVEAGQAIAPAPTQE